MNASDIDGDEGDAEGEEGEGNEKIKKTLVTDPYWEKINASDIDGDGDDDADDGDDDEHGNQDARRSDL